jgi:hypothetical protein
MSDAFHVEWMAKKMLFGPDETLQNSTNEAGANLF